MEKYLKPFMLLQGALAAAIAWLSNKLGILFPMLVILCFLMAADYITGMLASKKEALDHPDNPAYVIMILAGQVGLDVRKSVFFGLLATAWYILNEMLSIAENAGRMGANVPEWMLKYIAVLKQKIDDKGDGAE